jgi:AbrB family looped-hinge helix DNA binding protein
MEEIIRESGKIDNKYRVALPKKIREALQLKPGNVVFIEYEPQGNLIRLTRAVEDPIAVLWKQAEEEYLAGHTKDLRDYAKEHGLTDE